MDCRDAEDLLASYALGALDSSDVAALDSHVDGCALCLSRLREHNAVGAELAYAVPQVEVPPRVKQRLFSRIDDGADRERFGRLLRGLRSLLPRAGRRLAAHSGLAAAAAMVVVMVVGALWFDNRLSEVLREKETLVTQLESVALRRPESAEEAALPRFQSVAAPVVDAVTRVNEQRIGVLSHLASTPGTTVDLLLGTERSASAVGMVVSRKSDDSALLTALNLNPLPNHKVYKVWLVRGDQAYFAGEFSVDSTGYGQTIINIFGSPEEYDYMVITIEVSGGDAELLGESVLKGDL